MPPELRRLAARNLETAECHFLRGLKLSRMPEEISCSVEGACVVSHWVHDLVSDIRYSTTEERTDMGRHSLISCQPFLRNRLKQ